MLISIYFYFSVKWNIKDGEEFNPVNGPVVLAEVRGARCLQVARKSSRRKTTPGFHLVEKYAMLVGGCDGHRMDLSSMMLKDNHVWSAGGNITAAVRWCVFYWWILSLKVEVECRTEDEDVEAMEVAADVVILDNMLPPMLAVAKSTCRCRAVLLLVEVIKESVDVVPIVLSSDDATRLFDRLLCCASYL
ncbi:hypothetical protein PPL_08487 [Heterostelium album PN500]|uniref:Quinolinate phosphoribosyl transferase C-terminal domain-containing protein n=1 Tax=Heterostelium pallidum (strain ATCC 26659 / Pp 5 / PN500) TaxID=670386 RepID=D3BIB9_HETP5|nr:hypothetical protein PPL_08487 [Heterostelium album PN500]EFA79019.1 hypothetical protein PPL_08487 [Heterostelium album PN500]|eukprot:XP_020431142.1 hypothetical protein PPL_08487 [Heterostelium album PN500]